MEYWRYPLNYIKITKKHHQGKCIDFKWNDNYGGPHAPIYSIADGVVTCSKLASDDIGAGECVRIQHNNGYVSAYAHMQSGSRKVSVGQYVKKGQQIGNMGDTGNSEGCHLHLAIYSQSKKDSWSDSDIDPYPLLYKYPEQVLGDGIPSSIKECIQIYPEGDDSGNDKPVSYKYVYNVDDEGLVVRSSPNGTKTGELLQIASEVKVYETSGSWSRIGTNKWVHSSYLTDHLFDHYMVSGADSEGLNVRNSPSTSGTKLNCLKNGSKVQIYEISGSWAKVSKDESRWCSKNYLIPVYAV